ncbi:MAG TPA: hypothetical protein VJK04_03460 [Candidatus Paceibacterota bacterium]
MVKDYALSDLGEMLAKLAEDFAEYRDEFKGFQNGVNDQLGSMAGDVYTIKVTLPPLSSLVVEIQKDILELKRRIENLEKKNSTV